MRKILALAALLALVCGWVCPASAGQLINQRVRWITCTAAAGCIDSVSFSETGASNATRDTSVNIEIRKLETRGFIAAVSDSSLWARFTLYPRPGTTLGIAADSIYSFVEGVLPDGTMSGQLFLPLAGMLSTEIGTTNAFTFAISKARAGIAGMWGFTSIRWIVRGDMSGEYMGEVSFYQDE